MSRLQHLPSELRQTILLLALPTFVAVGRSKVSPHTNFRLICKSLNQDVLEIIKQYEPVYIVGDPAQLRYLRRLKRVFHVKLEIFSTSTIHNLREHVLPPWEAPPLETLLNKWRAEVVRLPKTGLKTVSVDISPVPGFAREKSQEWISYLVNEKKVSNKLFNKHQGDIASIMDSIMTRLGYPDNAEKGAGLTLIVEGFMSRKTAERIPLVLATLERAQRQGIRTHFEPQYLDDVDLPRFEKMLNPLVIAKLDVKPELQGEWKKVKAKLRRALDRDKGLRQVLYKNEMNDTEWVTYSIQRLGRLAIDPLIETNVGIDGIGEGDSMTGSVTFEQLQPLQRAWVHQLALVWGLHSLSFDKSVKGMIALKSVKVCKC
jgi:hypothetical protein